MFINKEDIEYYVKGEEMRPYQIVTDTNSDLPKKYIEDKGLIQVPQYTLLDGVTYEGAEGIDPADYYNRMAAGSTPQSQAINPAVCEEKFRAVLDAGKDILYISFSSALSSSYNIATMTANDLREEYPDNKIIIIDTLSASLGEGLIVMSAVDKQESGADIDTVAAFVEEIKLNQVTLFTVDTLKYLERGGRISKGAAIMGTVINIKPTLHIDDEGKLASFGKEKGRRKSISALLNTMETKMDATWKERNVRVAIAHGNCLDEAERVAQMITERFGITEFVINDVNPSIGVHSGPGTLCVAFYGTER